VRVLYAIGSKFAGGGIGTIAYHAVQGLYRHGFLQRLLCGASRRTEIPSSLVRAMGLPDRTLRKLASFTGSGRLWYLQSLLFDAWMARRLEPADLFHVWGNYGLCAMQRARGMGMATVIERASTHPQHQARLLVEEYVRWGLQWAMPKRALERAVAELALADYILIPSNFVRETFITAGVAASKLIQIPFGTDVQRFRPAEQQKPHPFRVLFVGQVSLRKGVLYLLQTWHKLGWKDAELWLAGNVATQIRPLLKQYDDLTGVQFLGHALDPVSLYQAADVFAFPSLEEGSALVTYEALACGLPVVTTPNAGSVVRDGVEGFIVPIRDVEALATALERLRADERLRLEMGRAARVRAEEFTWEKYGDSLARAYEQLALE
jgi:glycosyltransferase involved in cell wall biosynthesis